MLAIAAPPGFGLVRSLSADHNSAQQFPVPAPNAVHPTTLFLLDQQAMASGGATGFTNPNEEISTIFVVGFPEDMQEREFQNMFIFSPGFEAATLKIPSYTQEDVDVIHGLLNNTRKQSIGFAKFRSRVEALEARDILSGRKVDADKGCILKAEMAKKNLHTKRGLSNDQSCSLVSPSVASTRKGYQTTSAYDAFYSVPACGPAFSSDSLSPQDYTYELACGNGSSLGTSASMDLLSPPITASSAFGDIPFSTSTQLSGLATALDNRERVGGLVTVQRSRSAEGLHIQRQLQLPQQQEQKNEQLQYPLSNFSQIMRYYTPSSQMSRLNSTQSLLDLPDFSTTTVTSSELGAVGSRSNPDICSSISQSVPPTESQGFHSVLFGGAVNTGGNNTNGAGSPDRRSEESPINVSLPSSGIPSGLSRFGSLSINTTAANNLQNFANTFVNSPSTVLSPGYLPSPGLRSSNPGDQNPPCNTLYVGNLPANTNEEELRILFSKCVGYKRMCFRTKANGPMCFVEFDDVVCATQALHDLYGTPLSNSVKGGIRLSYSKNPLGVRQHPTFPSPVSVPNGSMYIPSGPLSAPPTTTTPPFSTFGPVTREIMASAAGSSYGSSLRESGGNGYASSLLREGMAMKRSGSTSSIGTIGQPINQQCSTLSTNRTAVNNNNNNTVASFSLAVSNSISPALAPVGTPAATNQLAETAATTPPLHQPRGIIGRDLLRTLSSETVSAFIEDVHIDPSLVKVEYEPQICIEYPPILGDRHTENLHNDCES